VNDDCVADEPIDIKAVVAKVKKVQVSGFDLTPVDKAMKYFSTNILKHCFWALV
jgi:hypothetical protein